ncbi:MAG: biotin/lipoyl-binding protein [Planctomycetes bacterium]|nr:biotin/lipoyl-binding protein [Planctomycetota bacterium]
MKYYISVNGKEHLVDVVERLGELKVVVDGSPLELDYEEVDNLGQVAVLCDGKSFGLSIEGDEHKLSATIAGHLYAVEIEDERERAAHAAERAQAKGGGLVKAVMPGIVVKLLVKEGDTVTKDQPLLILEAMKMQNEITAPSDGVVKVLHVREREAVSGGAKLVLLTSPT